MTDSQHDESRQVPELEVRRFSAVRYEEPLVAFGSLDEARRDGDAAVVLSGDYGGTIFLTVPVRLLLCTFASLEVLLSDMDAVTWMSGDLGIARVVIGRHPVGTGVIGGDGGGLVVEGVWTHPHRLPEQIRAQAVEVVLGRRARIDSDLLRAEQARELSRKREWRLRQPPLPRNLPWDCDISEPAENVIPVGDLGSDWGLIQPTSGE